MSKVRKKPQMNKTDTSQNQKVYGLHSHIYATPNGVFRTEEDNDGNISQHWVSRYINLKEQSLNIETNIYQAVIEYAPYGCDTLKTISVEGQSLAMLTKIEALSAYGVDVNSYNKGYVLKHLHNCKILSPSINNHTNLGFDQIEGEFVFKHHDLISFNQSLNSIYKGELNIEPRGHFDEWNQMIKEEVEGFPPLELAVIMGLASATIGFISKDLSIENLFINLVNDSSKGKTTACQLAASVYGSPILKDNGLVMSWNSTFNALQNKVAGNTGVVVVFDEASMARNTDFSKAIYSLAEGKETSRMQKDGIVKSSKVWNTLIISTGEKSLFEVSNNNSGLKVRLIELNNIIWTKSAEHSEKIKQVVSRHYGHAGIEYAKELMNRGKESLLEDFFHWRNQMKYNLPDSEFSDRIAMKLAVLMLTAEIANDLFSWNFNLDAIGSLLIQNESEKLQEADLAEQALERLFNYVSIKMDHFDIDRQNDVNDYVAATRDLWGKITYVSVKESHKVSQPLKEIMINKEKIGEILRDFNYESPQVVIKQWKAKGWLDCEQGKNYRKRRVNGITTSWIVFDGSKLPKDNDFIDINQLMSNGQVEEALKQNRRSKGDYTFKTSKEKKYQLKKERQLSEAQHRSA